MIAGMTDNAAVFRCPSQFVTVAVVTPMRSAACFWDSLRSRRRLQMWSPNVLICLGYTGEGGLGALSASWQKGNAGMMSYRHQGSKCSLAPKGHQVREVHYRCSVNLDVRQSHPQAFPSGPISADGGHRLPASFRERPGLKPQKVLPPRNKIDPPHACK